jgi:predicted DNA-binding transcriptional regulator YafY
MDTAARLLRLLSIGGGYHLGHGGRLPPLLLDDEKRSRSPSVCGSRQPRGSPESRRRRSLHSRSWTRCCRPGSASRSRRSPAARPSCRRATLPSVDAEVLVALAAGCRRTEGIKFTYRDHAGRGSERSVEPLHTVHTGRPWYLVARDRDRDAWRTFRIDRTFAPVLSGHRYRFDDPPDQVALVAEGMGVVPWEIEARVLVHADAGSVARALPPAQGVVEVVGASTCLLRFGANDLAPLIAHVARIPWEFTVLGPKDLCEAIRELGERLTRATASSPTAECLASETTG